MDPLVITATPNICWLEPDEVPYPQAPDAMAEEGERCQRAGAAVLHMHAEGRWAEAIGAVRRRTDVVLQCGMSSLPIPERMAVFESSADEISIILGHHDEAFAQVDVHALHPREELLEYCRLSRAHRVRLELEVWSTGHLWNLRWLIDKCVIDPPYITTLFFGWPGGAWSPPTISEYLHRRQYVPDHSFVTVSTMGREQIEIMTTAILRGDHVRVGTEDNPRNRAGLLVPTHVLVEEAARIAVSVGREVASPDQARRLLQL